MSNKEFIEILDEIHLKLSNAMLKPESRLKLIKETLSYVWDKKKEAQK